MLHVTSSHPTWTTPWVGYIVEGDIAFPLAGGTLDTLRAYAAREGFDGVLIGSPSVRWATDLDKIPVYV